MLSYRHAFHAGNHADVLKHFTQVCVLDYMLQKDKALCYIDTHAGPGLYQLTRGFAAQNAEFETGIAKLWQQKNLPSALQRYVDCVRTFNHDETLAFYPGSPAIAKALLREHDSLRLFELHPGDFELLQRYCEGDRRIRVQRSSGFEGLISLLPPRERRALILIDPPYEIKQDYDTVVTSIKGALKRFATGTYVIWYPLLARSELARMLKSLRAFTDIRWLNAELQIAPAAAQGMYGSGVFVINPPWPLAAQLAEALDAIKPLLGREEGNSMLQTHGLE